jgi:hypothetical protein
MRHLCISLLSFILGCTEKSAHQDSTVHEDTISSSGVHAEAQGGASGLVDTTSSFGTEFEASAVPTDGSGGTSSTSLTCEGEPGAGSCDVWGQDCPVCQKCMPYSLDSPDSWNDTKCVPVVEDSVPLGAACVVFDDLYDGTDNCEKGAICWDAEDGEGVCVALCSGDYENPECPLPKTACYYTGELILNLCIETCDPTIGDCPAGKVCAPTPSGMNFLCFLDTSGDEGQTFDPCVFWNDCDPGNACYNSSFAAVECDPMAANCCVPFCDLNATEDCPGADQECLPYGENPMPGLEHVGVCRLPE